MDWRSIRELLYDSLKLIAVIVVILFLMIYVVSITQVVGSSMKSTLIDGDVLILSKANYRFFDIFRVDIIYINYAKKSRLVPVQWLR